MTFYRQETKKFDAVILPRICGDFFHFFQLFTAIFGTFTAIFF